MQMNKNDKPLVSVIVAVYNGEKYLEECIRSVLKQSYTMIELILVDDGSVDSSLAICRKNEKRDERVKVIHQENGGVSNARNNALKIASGKYVCFVDQDDLLSNDYVEYLLGLINANDAQISVVPNVIYYRKGEQTYSEKRCPDDVSVWSGERAACEMMYSKMEIGPWSKMISKKLIEENSIHFYEGIFGGDGYAFSVESFAKAAKVAVGYKGIYYYRVDNYESEMSKYRHRTLESSLKAVKILMHDFEKSSLQLRRASKYAYWRVFVAFLNTLVASGTKNENIEDFKFLVRNSRKYAYRSFLADVPLKRKIKDLLYFLSPYLVAKINVRRNKKRDFNKG